MKKLITMGSLILLSSVAASAENISVGIILPSEGSYQREVYQSKAELRGVLGEDYEITHSVREFSNLNELEEAYRDLDSSTDVILSLDPISSNYLSQLDSESLLLAPFITTPGSIAREITRFQDIYPFRTLTLLTSREVPAEKILRELEGRLEAHITLAYIGEDTDITTDAIMVYNPARRDEVRVSALIRDSLDRGIPTFAVMSDDYVEGGALAGIVPGESFNRLIREAALDLEQSLSGSSYPAGAEDDSRRDKAQMLFNLSASKKLGIYPGRKVLNEAVFVGSYIDADEDLDFSRAVDIALENNLTLRSEAYSLDAFSFNPKRVRSNTRPNVDAFGQYTNQNDTYTQYSPYDAENTLRGGVRVSQSIFNDDLWKEIFVQERAYEAEKEGYRRNELDTVFTAGARFLEVLGAQASLNIKNYNLDLTREFLEIAKNRRDVGISDSSDVFRLESLHAQSRTEVRDGQGRVENSQRSLNQTLNLPLNSSFNYSPMSLEDESFLSSNEGFLEILENPVKVREFTSYYIDRHSESIPEVRSIGLIIEGKEREVKTASRRRYTPSVALEAEAAWDMKDPWGQHDEGRGKEDYWQLGVGFNLPIYKGGDIAYEQNQLSSELNALEVQRDAVIEDFGRVISSRITDLSVGYERIVNARRSAEASERNLDLVRDNYAKGTVSITNLLDAQNDAVSSKEEEVIAIYSFLISLLDLERTVGAYYFSGDSSLKMSLEDAVETINRGGYKNEN